MPPGHHGEHSRGGEKEPQNAPLPETFLQKEPPRIAMKTGIVETILRM
jgi:hypothetical protein